MNKYKVVVYEWTLMWMNVHLVVVPAIHIQYGILSRDSSSSSGDRQMLCNIYELKQVGAWSRVVLLHPQQGLKWNGMNSSSDNVKQLSHNLTQSLETISFIPQSVLIQQHCHQSVAAIPSKIFVGNHNTTGSWDEWFAWLVGQTDRHTDMLQKIHCYLLSLHFVHWLLPVSWQ